MDEGGLVKLEGTDDYPDTTVHWVEYRLHRQDCASQVKDAQVVVMEGQNNACACGGDSEIIHRSAHIEVKLGIMSQALAPNL